MYDKYFYIIVGWGLLLFSFIAISISEEFHFFYGLFLWVFSPLFLAFVSLKYYESSEMKKKNYKLYDPNDPSAYELLVGFKSSVVYGLIIDLFLSTTFYYNHIFTESDILTFLLAPIIATPIIFVVVFIAYLHRKPNEINRK